MPHINSSKGLTVDDIHTLIHNPELFKLNESNMSQIYTLFKNLSEIFLSYDASYDN